MVVACEASSDEGCVDVITRRQIGIKHGAYCRKEPRNDDVVFTRGRPDAKETSARRTRRHSLATAVGSGR
jgi:hypothetical protein